MDLLIIIKGFLLGWLIANFEPIQYLIKKYIKPKLGCGFIWEYIAQGLSCNKCLGFWITLISFCAPYEAIAVALLAFVFEKIMYLIPTKF